MRRKMSIEGWSRRRSPRLCWAMSPPFIYGGNSPTSGLYGLRWLYSVYVRGRIRLTGRPRCCIRPSLSVTCVGCQGSRVQVLGHNKVLDQAAPKASCQTSIERREDTMLILMLLLSRTRSNQRYIMKIRLPSVKALLGRTLKGDAHGTGRASPSGRCGRSWACGAGSWGSPGRWGTALCPPGLASSTAATCTAWVRESGFTHSIGFRFYSIKPDGIKSGNF